MVEDFEVYSCDVLVAGSGIAGLRAAVGVLEAGLDVVVATKSSLDEGSSRYAQGGVAASFHEKDTPVRHYRDSFSAGCGLSNPESLKLMVEEIPGRITELSENGCRFDTRDDGSYDLALEAGHGERRVLHYKDYTGEEIERCLLEWVGHYDYDILEQTSLIDLNMRGGRCVGGIINREGALAVVNANSTILATGGCGQLFEKSVDSEVTTGEGIGMCYSHGAKAMDMEFIQFHPTAIDAGDRKRMLLVSESIRGEGAKIVDSDGEEFPLKDDARGSLAPRDVLSRSIWNQLEKGIKVFLDATGIEQDMETRFPTVFENCMKSGIDPRETPIPITPAAHYSIGGLMIDVDCRSSIPGLYAVGETACSSVHGANRLGSNSLAEAIVFGARCGEHAAGIKSAGLRFEAPENAGSTKSGFGSLGNIRSTMWENLGVIREQAGMQKAQDKIRCLMEKEGDTITRYSMTTALLVINSALERRESRGVHYRKDCPETSSQYNRHIIMEK